MFEAHGTLKETFPVSINALFARHGGNFAVIWLDFIFVKRSTNLLCPRRREKIKRRANRTNRLCSVRLFVWSFCSNSACFLVVVSLVFRGVGYALKLHMITNVSSFEPLVNENEIDRNRKAPRSQFEWTMMVVASAVWGGVQGGYDDAGEVSALTAAASGGEQDYKLFLLTFFASLCLLGADQLMITAGPSMVPNIPPVVPAGMPQQYPPGYQMPGYM